MNPLLDKEIKEKIEKELSLAEGELSDFLLEAIWEYVVYYIGYNPMLGERKEKYKGNGTNVLYLNCRPIVSINEIKKNGIPIPVPTFSDEFIDLYTEKGFEKSDFPLLYDGYKVTDDIDINYVAGHEKIPSLLLLAVICFITSIKSSLGDESNLKSYKINTIAYTFKEFSEKNEEFKTLMRPFISY